MPKIGIKRTFKINCSLNASRLEAIMAQVNKILGILMGYRKEEVELIDGTSIKKEPSIPNSGSMYSSGTAGAGTSATATLSSTVTKAVLLSLANKGEKVLGSESYGCVVYDSTLKKSFAEITNVYNGEESTDVCIYSQSGACQAATINSNGDIEPFEIAMGKRQGTVIILAMLPIFLQDAEAKEDYEYIKATDVANKGFGPLSTTEQEEIRKSLARLSDNIYFRLKDINIKLNIEKSGKSSVPTLMKASLDAGAYAPTDTKGTIGGKDFEILVKSATVNFGGKTIGVDKTGFLTQFVLNPTKSYQLKEQSLIPELPSWYEIPLEAVTVCNNVVKSTTKARPMRNALLYGPAGTGKSEMSKAIAAGLHIPYTHMTCDAGMELFNLIGTILPATEGVADMTAEELADRIDLPTIEEIMFDKDSSYTKITGQPAPEGLTEMEVIQKLFDKQMDVIKGICAGGQEGKDFVYVPSELVKAVKNGWLCEIQEPNTIIQPGVLPGLNSMLEGGSFTIPTGEIIQRHPDSVIIFTMNVDYEGCRPLNESVKDRFPMKLHIALPDDTTLAERAAKVTGVTDMTLIMKCITVMNETREYLASQGCATGNIGPRMLYDWIDNIDMNDGDALGTAEYTLITSASDDEEIQDYIRTNILEVAF